MKAFIRQIASQLEAVYPADEAQEMAWWIAEELTGLSRTQLLCGYKGTTNFPHVQEIISRLLHFEPIQYVFGHTLWCGLDLKVTPATLIPRPETAEMVERIAQCTMHNAQCRVLDIGTGSGCIAIALKKRHPEWEVTGIDLSADAIEVARENARRNDVEVSFRQMDVFSDEMATFARSFDIIVSNPPYICEREKAEMRPNVLDYEPATALFVPDDDPLRFYRRMAELFTPSSVTPHPSPRYLFCEINEAYAAETESLLCAYGYTDIHVRYDIYGKARIIESISNKVIKKCI